MLVPARHFQILRLLSLALVAALLSIRPAAAQFPAPPPVAPAQFDPSDVYFQAYLAARAAEDAEKDRNFIDALEKLQLAQKHLNSITTYYPKWKPEMVAGRSAKTDESVTRVRPLAETQRLKKQGIIAELEGGQRHPVGEGNEPAVEIEEPNPLKVDPLDQKRLDEHDRNIERIRKELQAAMTPPAQVARQEALIKRLRGQLRASEASAAKLRSQLARAPMAGEVKSLNEKIGRLEQERSALSMALAQSRDEHTKTLAKAAILEADLKAVRQQAADLNRDLELQRTTTNETLAGMRRQLRSLQTTVEAKDKELAAAHNRINGLQLELQQSRDAYSQLRGEYDSLAAERDQMKALLNLNEAGRIQELIDQNMGLAKKLRVATEKMDILHRDNVATKDELLDALNDLVVAKSQINRLKQERAAQETRLAELKARLRREEHALANGLIAADPAEIATLRNIIKRQLLIQERRHQATEILLEAAKQLGAGNQNVSDAIAILEGPELQLTPEEKAIVAGRADADLFSPFALDPERANRNHNAQARDIASFDRAATKAFASDRYLSAREIFELIVEQNPGHVSSLCKLGVVNLKLDDPLAAADTFRRAVELDPNNPYAHRMLGFAIYTQGDIEGAEPSVRKAVELAQDDHNSQKLLGVIYYRLGRSKDSERHFKAAITADPMPSEPYFNLAMLCARNKRLNDARTYYQQALERGAIPDPNLEKTLSAH